MGQSTDAALVLTVGIIVAGLLLTLIIRRTEDFLNAASLFSLVWFLNLLACEVLPYKELRLELTTLLVVVGAWWLFLIGFLVSCLFRWPVMSGAGAVSAVRGRLLLVALIGLQIAAVVLEVRQTILLGGAKDLLGRLTALAEMRTSGTTGNVEIPAVWNIWRWDFALYLPLAFLLRKGGALRRRWLALTCAIALVSAVLRFTRAPLLNVITICIVGAWILRRPEERPWREARRRLVAVSLAFVAFALVFGVMQAALSKAGVGPTVGAAEALKEYAGGPLRAYQDLLQDRVWLKSDRIYSLDFLDFLAFKLGVRSNYEGSVRPWIDFGVTTNIYTFLDAFTIDAGVWGALMGSLTLGFGVGWLFSLARRRGGYWSFVMYSYSAYNCLMIGANNQFIQFGFFFTGAIALLFAILISAEPMALFGVRGEEPLRDS